MGYCLLFFLNLDIAGLKPYLVLPLLEEDAI